MEYSAYFPPPARTQEGSPGHHFAGDFPYGLLFSPHAPLTFSKILSELVRHWHKTMGVRLVHHWVSNSILGFFFSFPLSLGFHDVPSILVTTVPFDAIVPCVRILRISSFSLFVFIFLRHGPSE